MRFSATVSAVKLVDDPAIVGLSASFAVLVVLLVVAVLLKFTPVVPFDKLTFSVDVAIDRISVVADAVFKLSLVAAVAKLSISAVCTFDGLLVAVAVFRVLTDISLFTISVVAAGVKRQPINQRLYSAIIIMPGVSADEAPYPIRLRAR